MKLTAKSCLILALGSWAMLSSTSLLAQSTDTDIYRAIVHREFGTTTNELAAVERQIANTKPEQYSQIEERLLGVLADPEATMPGKQFACQMLRTVGSAKCVPAVAKLLTDEKLSHVARQVLVGMQTPEVETALRGALEQTQGALRIGIINTLGDRRNRASIASLAALLEGTDEATTRAALNALGKMGRPRAADALEKADVPAALKLARAQACLLCAQELAQRNPRRAEKLNLSLLEGDYPSLVRAGAFGAVVRAQKEEAVPLVLKTLGSDDKLLRRAAVAAVIELPGHGATEAFGQELERVAAEQKIVLLGALAARGDAVGLTARVNQLAADENPAVRAAAVKAIAKLGNAASVPVLVAALKQGETATVTRSMVELQGEGVTDALLAQFQTGEAPVRRAVLTAMAERHQAEALPAIRKAINDSDAETRQLALRNIATLGTQEDFVRLTDVLVATKDESDQEQVAQTLSAIGGRLPDKATRCEPVLQALPKADAQAKAALLTVLASLGGDPALQAVRASLSGAADLRKAAIRALSGWPDAAPLSDLLTIAKEDKETANQILALRGVIRLLGISTATSEEKLSFYKSAMNLCGQSNEKRQVLGGLAKLSHPEALKLIEPCLDDSELQREAFVSYERVAESLVGSQSAIAGPALQRVADKAPDDNLRNRAKRALERIK